MEQARRVGLVGVGTMGRGLARNLARAGHSLVVNDLRREAMAEGESFGARAADTLAALVQDADTVITCLPSVASITSVYLDADGLVATARPGTVLVDCSTSDPALTRQIAARAAERGVGFLDAAMLRTPQAAWDGTLHLVVGGDAATLSRAQPVLRAISERILHVGPVGAGHVLKLINNAVTITNGIMLCEAFTVARGHGVDLELLTDALGTSMASSRQLEPMSRRLIANDHTPLFAVDVVKKDISLYAGLAADRGLMSPLGDTVRDLMRLASAGGFGAQHYSRVATVLEGMLPPAG